MSGLISQIIGRAKKAAGMAPAVLATQNRRSSYRSDAPPAPVGFDAEAFFKGIYWHQRWEIFSGIETPGRNYIANMCDNLGLPADLSGKRVLDIGAWNGCLSFECERRGAREVVAIGPENPENSGFNKIRDLIGSKRTRYLTGSVYNLDPKVLGKFDIVLFCGVLYHLRYPMLGIDNIRRVCDGDVYVETYVIDNLLVLKEDQKIIRTPLGSLSRKLLSTPIWQFYRLDELEGDFSNWVGPNCEAVIQAFESAGFETQLIAHPDAARATFHGRVKKGLPEFLAIKSGEGFYYDILIKHLFGDKPGS